MYLRGNWSSVCPDLLCNPRRSQVAPGILCFSYLESSELEEFNGWVKTVTTRLINIYRVLRFAQPTRECFLIQAVRSPLFPLLPLHYNRNRLSEVTQQFLRAVDEVLCAP